MDLQRLRPFLTGEEFNNSLKMTFSREGYPSIDRRAIIKEASLNKNVLHIGYVAHSNVGERIKKGTWLHAQMMGWADRCMGLDIDCDGVQLLKDEYGIHDAVCADIEGDRIHEIAEESWDVAVLGEVLEHVYNPVNFLQSFKKYSNIKELVITVPNALYLKDYRRMLNYAYATNSDHRYSYSPYNLCKVVTTAGFEVSELIFCELTDRMPQSLKWKRSLFKRLGKEMKYPFYLFKGLTVLASNK